MRRIHCFHHRTVLLSLAQERYRRLHKTPVFSHEGLIITYCRVCGAKESRESPEAAATLLPILKDLIKVPVCMCVRVQAAVPIASSGLCCCFLKYFLRFILRFICSCSSPARFGSGCLDVCVSVLKYIYRNGKRLGVLREKASSINFRFVLGYVCRTRFLALLVSMLMLILFHFAIAVGSVSHRLCCRRRHHSNRLIPNFGASVCGGRGGGRRRGKRREDGYGRPLWCVCAVLLLLR